MEALAIAALATAVGGIGGAWVKSAIDSRSSESSQIRAEAASLRAEIIALRKVLDRRHTHLSAYASTLEIVLLAWQLPSLPEQIDTIRKARRRLELAIGSGGEVDGGP